MTLSALHQDDQEVLNKQDITKSKSDLKRGTVKDKLLVQITAIEGFTKSRTFRACTMRIPNLLRACPTVGLNKLESWAV